MKAESSTSAQLECAAEAAAAEKEESAAAAAAAAATKAEEKASPAAPLAEEDTELFESIKETLNHRVRPMLQSDGGDLEVLRFDRERGELYVHLLGSCRGCPSSTVTVKRGMEQMLRYYYPEQQEAAAAAAAATSAAAAAAAGIAIKAATAAAAACVVYWYTWELCGASPIKSVGLPCLVVC
ncbi:hypothetical protein Emag_002049 [Eimeria magna]